MRILDTDTCIEMLRGNRSVIARRLASTDEVSTTWVTACELYYGAARSSSSEKNRQAVDRFLETMEVLGIDQLSAQLFGEIKAMLRRKRCLVPDPDLTIGAIAAACKATVVTGNVRHFERIPGIGIENWIRH